MVFRAAIKKPSASTDQNWCSRREIQAERMGGKLIQIVKPETRQELAEEQVMMTRAIEMNDEQWLAHLYSADSLLPQNRYILLGIYRALERLERHEEAAKALERCRKVYPRCGRWTL
jgi:hypothetical protein